MAKFVAKKLYRIGIWQLANLYIRLLPNCKKMLTDDRLVLERIIFREIYTSGNYSNILFVGCSPFTRWYPTIFDTCPKITFSTVDPDLQKLPDGSKTHHRVARFESLITLPETHEFYDLVILNGVFGYGIDSLEDKLAALKTTHAILKPRGRVLIGYRDLENEPDLDLTLIDPDQFDRAAIPAFTCSRYLTKSENRHTFACFVKL